MSEDIVYSAGEPPTSATGATAAATERSLPLAAVGSRWRAKDGRIMSVLGWIKPVCEGDEPWAELFVENPRYRQRQTTTMGAKRFGAFLTPEPENV